MESRGGEIVVHVDQGFYQLHVPSVFRALQLTHSFHLFSDRFNRQVQNRLRGVWEAMKWPIGRYLVWGALLDVLVYDAHCPCLKEKSRMVGAGEEGRRQVVHRKGGVQMYLDVRRNRKRIMPQYITPLSCCAASW